MNTKETGKKIKEALGLNYLPVGMYYSDERPENAVSFNKKGSGCIMPLIFSSTKGKTIAFDKDTTGYACSAFYLGYQDWIFNGIECLLTDGAGLNRSGERFVKTKEQVISYVESLVPKRLNNKVTVFKPLTEFSEDEIPEIVIFFANADELSGLVYLVHYAQPKRDDIITASFASACGSVAAFPMKYKDEGKLKAVWGMHDISARLRLPKDLMTLTIPYNLLVNMCRDIDETFVITETWEKIKERNKKS
jgi:uncharacterized protein (DUF169 family)